MRKILLVLSFVFVISLAFAGEYFMWHKYVAQLLDTIASSNPSVDIVGVDVSNNPFSRVIKIKKIKMSSSIYGITLKSIELNDIVISGKPFVFTHEAKVGTITYFISDYISKFSSDSTVEFIDPVSGYIVINPLRKRVSARAILGGINAIDEYKRVIYTNSTTDFALTVDESDGAIAISTRLSIMDAVHNDITNSLTDNSKLTSIENTPTDFLIDIDNTITKNERHIKINNVEIHSKTSNVKLTFDGHAVLINGNHIPYGEVKVSIKDSDGYIDKIIEDYKKTNNNNKAVIDFIDRIMDTFNKNPETTHNKKVVQISRKKNDSDYSMNNVLMMEIIAPIYNDKIKQDIDKQASTNR